MADDTKSTTSNVAGNAFLWVFLLGTGSWYLFGAPPLQGTRPDAPEAQISQHFVSQDIPARLWQDPFAAVSDTVKSDEAKAKETGVDACALHQCSPMKDVNPSGEDVPLVMGVMVSGAPYPENAEFRRRIRYAVLAGLDVAHYHPADSQHIGLYRPILQGTAPYPPAVPFEWLKRTNSGDGGSGTKKILLLWLDEDVLRLNQIGGIVCGLTEQKNLQAKILGPEQSATLLELMEDATKRSYWVPCRDQMAFYSYSATIEDQSLINAIPACKSDAPDAAQCLKKYGIRLDRTIATDLAVARALSGELCKRDADPGLPGDEDHPNHVAIVSEWDTLYGQSLPGTLARAFSCGCDETCVPDPNLTGEDALTKQAGWIHRYSYLRGLDGKLPPKEATRSTAAEQQSSDQQQKSSDTPKGLPTDRPSERADGLGQFDYLVRLADAMRALDTHLRSKNAAITAIGVVGSDVYDKLLVLQALRPEFPDAVFFTTDLDARLLDSHQQPYTHNLLVGSPFDLKLAGASQKYIPPFRDDYQTAAFYSVSLALGATPPDGLTTWAQLFEIGRTQAIQLKDPPGKAASATKIDKPRQPRDRFWPALGAAFVVSIVLILLRWGWTARAANWLAKRAKITDDSSKRSLMRGIVWLIVFVLCLAACWSWPWGVPDLLWLDQGVNLWPTIVIRIFSILLCITAITKISSVLERNIEKIADNFKIFELRKAVIIHEEGEDKSRRWDERLERIFFAVPASQRTPLIEGLTHEQAQFWDNFIYRSQPRPRLCRVLIYFFTAMLIFAALYLVFGFPRVPHRDAAVEPLYDIVTYLELGTMLLLTIFVGDATWLTCLFVKECGGASWPLKTYALFRTELALVDEHLNHFLALGFVAARSACIAQLIYWPFIIIALGILSRSAIFGDVQQNWPVLITQVMALTIAFLYAVALRVYAEQARARADSELRKRIIAAEGATGGSQKAGQLEWMLNWVTGLHGGAFMPLSQQPLVKALLLPLGTYGGTAALQHFVLASF